MNRRELINIGVALSALTAGMLVYAVGRDLSALAWLPTPLLPLQARISGPASWSGSLPSFLHTLGFVLLIIVAAGLRRRAAITVASLAWVGLESLFEIGQHPAVASFLATRLAGLPELDAFVAYFVNGTFDPFDLLAVALAGGLAWTIASRPLPEENRHV